MTILAELSGTVTVTDDGSASLLGDVEITDDNPFWFVLSVDARASVAFAQRFQQHGYGIKVNGVAIPDREIGKLLTITESADSYGDRLTFRLDGARFSPFSRALLRSKAHVEVFHVNGNTRNEFRKKVFDGYVVSSSFDGHPPAATVSCLDAAALHAQKRAKTWTLPANSGRSRLSIGLELCALCEIPTGHIDLGGDGGTVRKALAPGDQPILDFLRDFWGVLGAEIGFEDGLLCARRYDASLPPVLEINANNILIPFGITSPDTLAPNVTGVVAVSFSQEEIGGLRTVETSVITVGPYAPLNVDGTADIRMRTISEVITRTTYLGTLDVLTVEEEFGWYARRAAPNVIQFSVDPPGWELIATPWTTYTYPDGSTRAESIEQYRLLRRSVVRKTVDADYNVIATREEGYSLSFRRKAIWQFDGAEDVLTGGVTYITDDGEGVMGGAEMMGGEGFFGISLPRPDTLKETTYELNADGTIKSETSVEHFYDIGSPRRRATGAYAYGLDNPTYASRSQDADGGGDPWGGLITTKRRYRVVNEDRYVVTETVTGSNVPLRTTTSTMTGAPPRPERAEPETVTQELRAIVEDRERIALAGESIEKIEANEFIESSAEAAYCARVLARRAGARALTCAVPVEQLVHKFRMVRANLPGSSIHGLKFYVRDVERDGDTHHETITAEYYSPELS